MIVHLRKLVSLLDRRANRNALILLLLMLVAAVLEVVGIASVPAFVAAVVQPETLSRFSTSVGLPPVPASVDQAELVTYGAIALGLAFAFKTAFLVLNFYAQIRYTTNRRIELSRRLTRAYMRAPYAFHLQRNTAEMLRNVDREASVIAYSVIGSLLDFGTRLVILVGVLAFLFYVEPWITLFWAIFFGFIAACGFRLVGTQLKNHGLAEQGARKKFVQALYQGIGAFKEARVFNREQFFENRIGTGVSEIADAVRFKMLTGKLIAPLSEFFAVAGLLGVSTVLVLSGRPIDSILVTLSLFVVGLVRLRETVNAALYSVSNLRYNMVSIDPVFADLKALEADANERAKSRPVRPPHPFLKTCLELRDVWHRYEGQESYALRGVDVRIPVGAAVALVGSTGAGKSTLVDMLLGLHDPEKGGVFVDGRDIRNLAVGTWQSIIGYVPQSINLLDDTIRRNIALGVPDDDIDDERVRAAAEKAQLSGFLKDQPHGLDTVVGEQGVRISGGERQRIGIARALYNDPEVLVLDEATSSLDNETERALIAAIEASKGDRTIIMIAHRLSTVRNCSTLYYLKSGQIEASGTYQELQARSAELRVMSVHETDMRASA